MYGKYFPLDKNFILKQAQVDCYDELMISFVGMVIENYLQLHNPLGLVDDTVAKMRSYQDSLSAPVSLNGFYDNLAAIYRFQHVDNQLEILWDGSSHYDKFRDEWGLAFKSWVDEFCATPSFIKLVLGVTVFNDGTKNLRILENHLKGFIHSFFNLKIKNRKIQSLKRAV